MYKVEKHNGRANAEWRPIHEGDDRDQAQEVYTTAFAAMKRGGVRLVQVTPTGEKTLQHAWTIQRKLFPT